MKTLYRAGFPKQAGRYKVVENWIIKELKQNKMKIHLTDINIAIIIIQNITKAESGTGVLTIELPHNISLIIDYQGNTLESRCIRIISDGKCVQEWKGGDIMIENIENCLSAK